MWFTLLISYIVATQPVKFLPIPLTSAYICLHIVDLLLKSARPINFLPPSRDMVQLRSKETFARVQTHPASISGTSCKHFRYILHASHIWKKRAWHSHTSCCSFVTKFCSCMDASCMHPRRVLHAFQMHANVTLELSCTVMGWNWVKTNRFLAK